MRTTLTLADDVVAAIEQVRRERSIGMSDAVNELIRAGLASQSRAREPFRQKSYDIGVHINVDNIAEQHQRAAAWLTDQLNGSCRVGHPGKA